MRPGGDRLNSVAVVSAAAASVKDNRRAHVNRSLRVLTLEQLRARARARPKPSRTLWDSCVDSFGTMKDVSAVTAGGLVQKPRPSVWAYN